MFPEQQPVSQSAPQREPSLIEQFVMATKAINPGPPSNADAFEIAQHASAQVRMADTPQTKATLEVYSKLFDAQINKINAQTASLLNS